MKPHASNPIKLREIIIAASVAVILLVLGGIFDFQLSEKVYVPGSESWYGIIGAAVVELPVCLGLGFGGASLILNRFKYKKWIEIAAIVIGAIAIGLSIYFIFDTFNDISDDIQRMAQYKKIITILAILFALVMESLIVGLAALAKYKLHFDEHDMLVLGLFMLVLAAGAAIVSNGAKFLWSRPRPRYIFSLDDPKGAFHSFWQIDPLASLLKVKKMGISSGSLKSFPSGHTTYAATGMFVLPYIASCSKKVREDRRILVILFYIGLLWAVLAGLSRVYAGAHFLSDTAAGMLVTLLVGSLMHFLFVFKKEKASEAEA